MHIPDGILPTAVCLGGYAAAGAVTWYSLKKINRKEDPREDVPKASLLTAAFFVASLIHIPIPPASIHFILNGLLGVVLGYYAVPSILIGLFFQAVMFQHGGLTTLGVNTVIMGVPALIAFYVFSLRKLSGRDSRFVTGLLAFIGGALGVSLGALAAYIITISFIPSHLDVEAEKASIYLLALSHIPLMIIEGIFTAMVVLFLQKVKPALLEGKNDSTD